MTGRDILTLFQIIEKNHPFIMEQVCWFFFFFLVDADAFYQMKQVKFYFKFAEVGLFLRVWWWGTGGGGEKELSISTIVRFTTSVSRKNLKLSYTFKCIRTGDFSTCLKFSNTNLAIKNEHYCWWLSRYRIHPVKTEHPLGRKPLPLLGELSGIDKFFNDYSVI